MPYQPTFYTIRPLDFASAAETNFAAGHPVEKALDHNLDTFFRANTTGDNTVTIDLANDCQERIANAADREFSSTVNWANVDMNTWAIAAGTMQMYSSASGQYCHLVTAGLEDFQNGETYRITYTYTQSVTGYRFQCGTTNQIIGTCVAGTAQTIDFTCTGNSAELLVVATASGADGTLDDVKVRRIDSAYSVSGYGAWVRNYNTSFGSSHELRIEYSDDNTNWVEQADRLIDTQMTHAVGEPLKLYVWSTAEVRRYWRITSHDVTTIPDVGQLFLLSSFAPGISGYYPEAEERQYGNRITRVSNRRTVVEPGYRNPTRVLHRAFRVFSDTARDAFIEAYDACRGEVTPIILKEGSDYYVARIISSPLRVTSIDYQVYEIPLTFETLPYISDGQVT